MNTANTLISGRFETLGTLTSLRHAFVFNSRLSGMILPSIGQLTQLEQLNFHGMPVSGTLPAATLGELSSLIDLRFQDTLVSGLIPSSIGGLSDLTWVDGAGSKLSGTLPPSLFRQEAHDSQLQYVLSKYYLRTRTVMK